MLRHSRLNRLSIVVTQLNEQIKIFTRSLLVAIA